MNLEFGIFGGFGWVHSLVLVDEPGFGRVLSSVFQDLDLGSACFWPNEFKVQAFWRGSNGSEVWFWSTKQGSSELAVRSLICQVQSSSKFIIFDLTLRSKKYSILFIVLQQQPFMEHDIYRD